MLSILIPTYNYNIVPLVENILQQAIESDLIFEIIVLDDASWDENLQAINTKINDIPHCSYKILEKNIGRSAIRNLLAKTAKFDTLLFLDADTMPVYYTFLKNYYDEIMNGSEIVFGGIAYKKEKPIKENILRWKYGSAREEITVLKRNKNPYKTALTSNLLIKKEIFNIVKFNKNICDYGFEDLVFIQDLKSKKYIIKHIENTTFHLNYETSIAFLEKTKKALETLKFIEENNILSRNETKILKSYLFLKRMRMTSIFMFFFKKLNFIALKNLNSANPSLLMFDIYKLGYYCEYSKIIK